MSRIASIGGIVNGTGISITERRPLGTPTPTPAPTPTVSISAAQSQAEGNSGTKTFTYTVTRSATVGAAAVPWSFAAGGTAAADFQGGTLPAGGTVNMADGVATGQFTITTTGDATVEGDEAFTVSISAPAGYALGSPSSATGTILNDDSAAPTFNTIVPEGDSNTSNIPQTPNGSYAYGWKDEHPGLTITVTAAGSRTVGGAAYNGDLADLTTPGDNSLFGQVANDLALNPDLVTAKIGVNDISSTGVQMATYIQRLKDWAALIRAGGAKIAYGVPTPLALGTEINQTELDYYMAKWDTLFTTHNVRNPANWSQWADYYIPMGEHPDFLVDGAWTLDGVHPTGESSNSTTGNGKLLTVYRAAMDTLLDTTRFNSAGPYEAVWDAFGPFTDIAAGETITRRVVVSGIAWGGSATGVSVSGAAGSPSVETNGKTAPGYTYNGDVIDLTLTVSGSFETDRAVDLTIGGETRTLTFRTAADVAPAIYVHGGFVKVDDASNTLNGTVEDDGLQVIIVKTRAAGTTVTVDGVAATLRKRDAAFADYALEIFDGPGVVGDPIVVTLAGGFFPRPIMSFGAIVGGVFNSAVGTFVANEGNPHQTDSGTVPANGIFVGGHLFDANGGGSVNTGTTLEGQDTATYQGGFDTIIVGSRATTGTLSFNSVFGTLPRAGVVYEAG